MPTGTFLMGNDRSPNPEEKPAHQVNLRSFFIGRYEITRQQWNIVATTLPRINRSLRQQYLGQAGDGYFSETTPADTLSWEEAVEFCATARPGIPAKSTGSLRKPSGNTPAGLERKPSIPSEINSIQRLPTWSSPRISCCEWESLATLTRGGFTICMAMLLNGAWDHQHANLDIGAPRDGSAWTRGGDESDKSLRGGRYRFIAAAGRSSARAFYTKNLFVTGFGLRVVAEVAPSIGDGNVTATSAARATQGSALRLIQSPPSSASICPMIRKSLLRRRYPSHWLEQASSSKTAGGYEFASPLFFASPNQINFQIPSGLALGAGLVSVVTNGDIHSTGSTRNHRRQSRPVHLRRFGGRTGRSSSVARQKRWRTGL